jgi:hypothetical protein
VMHIVHSLVLEHYSELEAVMRTVHSLVFEWNAGMPILGRIAVTMVILVGGGMCGGGWADCTGCGMVMVVVVVVGLCPNVGTYLPCQQLLIRNSKSTVGSRYKYSDVGYVEFVGSFKVWMCVSVYLCECVCEKLFVVFVISILLCLSCLWYRSCFVCVYINLGVMFVGQMWLQFGAWVGN